MIFVYFVIFRQSLMTIFGKIKTYLEDPLVHFLFPQLAYTHDINQYK